MGMAHTFILMVINIMVIGKAVRNMVKAHFSGPVVISMRENGILGKYMGKVCIPGLVATNM